MLVTGESVEPSVVFEIIHTETDNWLTDGWSADVITTPARGGFGIAKDIAGTPDVQVDLGAYVTQDYAGALRGEFDPELGVGLSVRF